MPVVSELSTLFTSDVSGLTGGLSKGVGSVRSFTSTVDRAAPSITKMESVAQRAGSETGSAFAQIAASAKEAGLRMLEVTGIAAAAALAFESIVDVAKGFRLASQFETASVQLRALAGSGTLAAETLGGLRELAAGSPFEFPDLLDSSKRLLAVGVAAGSVVPLLREIGDVAAGVGVPVGDIADQFARAAAEGHVGSRELLEMGRSGIPVVAALASQFHTTAAGVSELAEQGRIGIGDLKTAFDQLTGPAGRFGGILAAQSRTIGGEFHALATAVDDVFADVAESLINAFDLRPALRGVTSAVTRVGPMISAGLDSAAPYIQRFIAGAASTFGTIYDVVAPVVSRLWTYVGSAWSGIASVVQRYAVPITAAVEGALAGLGAYGLPALLGGVASGVGLVASGLASLAGVVVSPIAGAIALGAAAGILIQRFGLVERATAAVAVAVGYVGAHWRDMVGVVTTAAAGMYAVVSGEFTAIGQLTTAVWSGVSEVVVWAWGGIRSAAAAASDYLGPLFNGLGLQVRGFAQVFTAATATVGFVFSHLSDVAELVGVTVAAEVVEMANRVQYVLTGVIPAYLKWFGDNWLNVFRDVFANTGTLFANLATNVGNMLGALPGLVSGKISPDQFLSLWRPLTDGFQTTLSALPQIADRQVGAVEATLRAKQKSLSDAMGDGVAAAIRKQQDQATAAAKAMTDAVSGIFGGAKPIEVRKPKIEKPDPVKVAPLLDPSALSLSITPEIKRPTALRSGSAESQAARFRQPTVSVSGGGPVALAGGANPAAAMVGQPAAVPSTDGAAGPQSVKQLQQAAQAAYRDVLATQKTARASDATGGRQHATDQVAARTTGALYKQAQDALTAARAGQSRPTNPIAATRQTSAPSRYGYQNAGRGELTDTVALPGGLHAARSASTGMSAVLDDDQLARLRSAQRSQPASVGPRVGTSLPVRPSFNRPDSIAQWRGSRPAAQPDSITAYRQAHPDAFTAPAAAMPSVGPIATVPGVSAVQRETARSSSGGGGNKMADAAKQQTNLLNKIELNTRGSTQPVVSIG